MRKEIGLNESFILRFNVKRDDATKVRDLLIENGYHPRSFTEIPFAGFIELRVPCNLRKAELIRQLLKNIML